MVTGKNVQGDIEGYECSDCGAELSINDKICPKCGADVSELVEDEEKKQTENLSSLRYPALRTIAGVYQVLSWVVAVVAGIGVLFALDNLEKDFNKLILLFSIVSGAVGFITLLAVSESIKVFIDIEENTRKVAEFQRGKT